MSEFEKIYIKKGTKLGKKKEKMERNRRRKALEMGGGGGGVNQRKEKYTQSMFESLTLSLRDLHFYH